MYMKGETQGPPTHEPRAKGRAGLLLRIPRPPFFFEPGRNDNLIMPDVVASPKSRQEGLGELRKMLGDEIALHRLYIELAIQQDDASKVGLAKMLDGIDRLVLREGESREDIARSEHGSLIASKLKVMEAVNNGDEQFAIEYLIARIRDTINSGQAIASLTEGVSSGDIWTRRAQKDIFLLGKIDTGQARILQEYLEEKERSPVVEVYRSSLLI